MAGSAKVRIRGLDVLEKRLRALPEVVARGGKRAVKDETHEVAQDMRRAAPRDTGALVDGIQTEIDKGGLEGKAVSTARHTTFVVHGTSDTKANDFMTPAAERSRRRFPDRVRDEVRAELKRMT